MNAEKRLQLLVVDDDQVDRMALVRALKLGGIDAEVVEAVDCESAYRALGAHSFHCVLLDFHLPDGTGFEVLLEAKAMNVRAPFIVLTGVGDEQLAVELMKSGASDYLPKGLLSPERLAQSLRHTLRVHAAEEREARARAALARQAEQLSELAEASRRVHATLSTEELLERIAEEARALIGAHIAVARMAVLPSEPWASHASFSTTYAGPRERDLDPAMQPLEQAVVGGDPSMFLTRAQLYARLHAQGVKLGPNTPHFSGWLAAPIRGRDGEALGVLQLSDSTADEFQSSDLALLVQVAQTASVALENARLYRQAREATRARDEVLAIVSHDLRNPLNAVAVSTSMLRGALGDSGNNGTAAQRSAYLHRIDRGIDDMTRLIEDLMDASRIEAGALVVAPIAESARLLVADAVESAAAQAEAKGCKLVVVSPDEGLAVLADRGRILQVFNNVVGNALKFTGAGGTVTLAASANAGFAMFSVTDTGPGIEKEHVEHLFTRYWRALQVSRDGAGLGLYIAHGIVHAHGGTIVAKSAVGRGTTIEFSLPLAQGRILPAPGTTLPAGVSD